MQISRHAKTTGRAALLLGLSLLASALTFAQEQHADYVVMGKSINHRQSASGELTLLNTVFFAEVFKTPGGEVSNAVLTGPGYASRGMQFPDGDILFLAGPRQYSIEAITEVFPDDTYYFSFDTPDGRVDNMPVTFQRDEGEIRNLGPIEVTLFQLGQIADPLNIDPDAALTVRWTPFSKGAEDLNGITDDMIYVMMGDCLGNETVHSGHAISNPNALTYQDSEFTIPASKLYPGQPFQLEIEHSNSETDRWNNIEQIVTYAATTFLDIKTTGVDGSGANCLAQPYAMDGGQTDRESRPN